MAVYYIDPKRGDNKNPGTKSLPMKNILPNQNHTYYLYPGEHFIPHHQTEVDGTLIGMSKNPRDTIVYAERLNVNASHVTIQGYDNVVSYAVGTYNNCIMENMLSVGTFRYTVIKNPVGFLSRDDSSYYNCVIDNAVNLFSSDNTRCKYINCIFYNCGGQFRDSRSIGSGFPDNQIFSQCIWYNDANHSLGGHVELLPDGKPVFMTHTSYIPDSMGDTGPRTEMIDIVNRSSNCIEFTVADINQIPFEPGLSTVLSYGGTLIFVTEYNINTGMIKGIAPKISGVLRRGHDVEFQAVALTFDQLSDRTGGSIKWIDPKLIDPDNNNYFVESDSPAINMFEDKVGIGVASNLNINGDGTWNISAVADDSGWYDPDSAFEVTSDNNIALLGAKKSGELLSPVIDMGSPKKINNSHISINRNSFAEGTGYPSDENYSGGSDTTFEKWISQSIKFPYDTKVNQATVWLKFDGITDLSTMPDITADIYSDNAGEPDASLGTSTSIDIDDIFPLQTMMLDSNYPSSSEWYPGKETFLFHNPDNLDFSEPAFKVPANWDPKTQDWMVDFWICSNGGNTGMHISYDSIMLDVQHDSNRIYLTYYYGDSNASFYLQGATLADKASHIALQFDVSEKKVHYYVDGDFINSYDMSTWYDGAAATHKHSLALRNSVKVRSKFGNMLSFNHAVMQSFRIMFGDFTSGGTDDPMTSWQPICQLPQAYDTILDTWCAFIFNENHGSRYIDMSPNNNNAYIIVPGEWTHTKYVPVTLEFGTPIELDANTVYHLVISTDVAYTNETTSGRSSVAYLETDAPGDLSDGDGFTLYDATTDTYYDFEYDVTGTYTPGAGINEIDVSGDATAIQVRDTTKTAIDGACAWLSTAIIASYPRLNISHSTDGFASNTTNENVVSGGTEMKLTQFYGGCDSSIEMGLFLEHEDDTEHLHLDGTSSSMYTSADGSSWSAVANAALRFRVEYNGDGDIFFIRGSNESFDQDNATIDWTEARNGETVLSEPYRYIQYKIIANKK